MIKLDFKKIIGYFICCNEKFFELKILRDWKALLFSFFVFLIIVFFLAGYFYWDYQQELNSGFTKNIQYPTKTTTLNKESLKTIFYGIERREKLFNENLEHIIEIKDPSL